jgi:hypothetical protein
MARIRSLKPEMWMSPQVMNLSHSARLLFIGLITQADDEGRGTADARRLKAAIFGGDDITSADVRRMLDECQTQGLVVTYHAENHGELYTLPSWRTHQSIDRPRKSVYPNPPETEAARRALVEERTSPREGSEGNGGERSGSSARAPDADSGGVAGSEGGGLFPPSPPSPPATRAHAFRGTRLPEDFLLTTERRAAALAEGVDPARTFAKFCDYWRGVSGAKGTKLDWDATWRNWCRSEGERNPRKSGGADNGLPTLVVS